MSNVLGGLLAAAGMIGMFAIWIYTSVSFFGSGETALGLIALLVPPADIVLPFLISPALGLLGIAALIAAFAGFALRRN